MTVEKINNTTNETTLALNKIQVDNIIPITAYEEIIENNKELINFFNENLA